MGKKIQPRIGTVVYLRSVKITKTVAHVGAAGIYFGNGSMCLDPNYFNTENYEVIWAPPTAKERRAWKAAAQHLRDVAENVHKLERPVPDNAIPEVEFVWCYPCLHDDIAIVAACTPNDTYLRAAEIAGAGAGRVVTTAPPEILE